MTRLPSLGTGTAPSHSALTCSCCQVSLTCTATANAWLQAYDQAAIVRHAHSIGPTGAKPAQLVTNFPPEYYQVSAGLLFVAFFG